LLQPDALPVIVTGVPADDGDTGEAEAVTEVQMGTVVVITWKRLGMKRIGVNQAWVEGVRQLVAPGAKLHPLIAPTA
jgi:hypothetical protein